MNLGTSFLFLFKTLGLEALTLRAHEKQLKADSVEKFDEALNVKATTKCFLGLYACGGGPIVCAPFCNRKKHKGWGRRRKASDPCTGKAGTLDCTPAKGCAASCTGDEGCGSINLEGNCIPPCEWTAGTSTCAKKTQTCDSYSATQTDSTNCEANDCTWAATCTSPDCSDYSSDQTTCNAFTETCEYRTAGCNGEESETCSAKTTASACTSPCTWTDSGRCTGIVSCASASSGWTQASCDGTTGCTWDNGQCTGDMDSGNIASLTTKTTCEADDKVWVPNDPPGTCAGKTPCSGNGNEGSCNALTECEWLASDVCGSYSSR